MLPLMALVPPLTPPKIFPPELQVYRKFAHACISLYSSCLLSVLFSFIRRLPRWRRSSPRRPPVRLTGGRCHATPCVLGSVSMFGGFAPPPDLCGRRVLGSGCG